MLLKILRGNLVHPVLELVHHLVLGRLLHRLLEDDGGLLDHLVGSEDLRPRADRDDYGAGGKEVQVDPVDGHPGEAVSAHWLYAPLTTRSCGDSLTPCRFYCPPRRSSIRLSATPPCCTLTRRRIPPSR